MIPDCSPDEFILRKIQQKAASANFWTSLSAANPFEPWIATCRITWPKRTLLGLLAVYFWRHSLKSLAQRGKQKQRRRIQYLPEGKRRCPFPQYGRSSGGKGQLNLLLQSLCRLLQLIPNLLLLARLSLILRGLAATSCREIKRQLDSFGLYRCYI